MLKQEGITKIYDRWGNVYDFVFNHVLNDGRKKGVSLLELQSGERLLEVGVGTGLSLPMYHADVHVTGIDVSSKMLKKAYQKVRQFRLYNVELHQMNAQDMGFEDDSFDCAIICYTLKAVPDPNQVIAEMRRVCRPGGRIVVVSHSKSHNRLLAKLEKGVNGVCNKLGWETTLDLVESLRLHNLEPEAEAKVNIFDYWRAILCINRK